MTFYPELVGMTFQELVNVFEQPRHPEGVIFYQEVACALRAYGDIGAGYLLGKLSASRIMQIRGAILGLTHPPVQEAALASLLQQALHHKHGGVVMDAIDALKHLGDQSVSQIVIDAANHASPYVRGAVVRYIADLLPEQIVTMVIPALHDPHFVVRESAIDALDDCGYDDAIDAIRPLLDDPHPDVRQAAATAVEHFLR